MIEEYTNEKSCINFKTYGYTHLRAFHACKPLRIEDYLKDEIKQIYYMSALQDAKDRIVSNNILFAEAVAKLNAEWNKFDGMHKRVWLKGICPNLVSEKQAVINDIEKRGFDLQRKEECL